MIVFWYLTLFQFLRDFYNVWKISSFKIVLLFIWNLLWEFIELTFFLTNELFIESNDRQILQCSFFLWDSLKFKVYVNRPDTINALMKNYSYYNNYNIDSDFIWCLTIFTLFKLHISNVLYQYICIVKVLYRPVTSQGHPRLFGNLLYKLLLNVLYRLIHLPLNSWSILK